MYRRILIRVFLYTHARVKSLSYRVGAVAPCVRPGVLNYVECMGYSGQKSRWRWRIDPWNSERPGRVYGPQRPRARIKLKKSDILAGKIWRATLQWNAKTQWLRMTRAKVIRVLQNWSYSLRADKENSLFVELKSFRPLVDVLYYIAYRPRVRIFC